MWEMRNRPEAPTVLAVAEDQTKEKKPMKKTLIGLTTLALLLVMLTSCGAVGGAQPAYEPVVEQVVVEKVVESEAPAGDSDTSVTASSTELGQPQVERMIIWNADISLTVEDAKESMAAVQTVARSLGGYTTGSESWLSDDQLHARITIRVPAEKFEDAMAQLRDLALKVNRESASSEDVTDQYVDLESRLRHLEAKEAQLLEFLGQAEDTEAALAVYDHLAETQAEIEQVKGRMNYLETLSAMATIVVELYPEEAEPPVVEEGWKPARTLRSAARALVNTLETLADVAIWFAIYLLPILLFLALPIILIVWFIRRRRRRKSQVVQGPDESSDES
jgi:hypothetical protein